MKNRDTIAKLETSHPKAMTRKRNIIATDPLKKMKAKIHP